MDKLTEGVRPYLLLSLLWLIFSIPGLASIPPLDRDEARFVQASRQMVESGDYVRIQFQDEMRAKKPVGAYWLQVASVKAFGRPDALWPHRLPSALAALAVTLMTFAFGRSLLGRMPALIGAIMMGSALMLISEAHQAKSDAILLVCSLAAQGTLARFYVAGRAADLSRGLGKGSAPAGPGLAEALVFWLAQGAGILVKGPMVPAISLLTIVTLVIADRKWRWLAALRPVVGVLITAAIALPWFVAISKATQGAFVGEAIKSDLLPKLLGAQESHGGWPGYYMLLAMATFWPASLFAWPAMIKAWGERKRLVFRFLLAWALPCWVMFEIVPTKLPHYILPAYPAIALITAGLVAEGAEVFRHRLAKIYYVIWCAIGLALAAAVVILPMKLGRGFEASLVPVAIAIVLATLLPATLALQGRLVPAALALALAGAATYPAVFSQVLPGLDQMWVSRNVARVVDSLGIHEPVAAAGYNEPSLVVLLGTHTRLTNGGDAADYLAAHPRTVAVVAGPEKAAFLAQAAANNLAVEPLGHVEGLNYSRGKRVAIDIYGTVKR